MFEFDSSFEISSRIPCSIRSISNRTRAARISSTRGANSGYWRRHCCEFLWYELKDQLVLGSIMICMYTYMYCCWLEWILYFQPILFPRDISLIDIGYFPHLKLDISPSLKGKLPQPSRVLYVSKFPVNLRVNITGEITPLISMNIPDSNRGNFPHFNSL